MGTRNQSSRMRDHGWRRRTMERRHSQKRICPAPAGLARAETFFNKNVSGRCMMDLSMRLTCPQCGWSDIRPSYKTSLDELLEWLWLEPFRCRCCNARFRRYRYRWARIVAPLLAMLFVFAAAGTGFLVNRQRQAWSRKPKIERKSTPAGRPQTVDKNASARESHAAIVHAIVGQ